MASKFAHFSILTMIVQGIELFISNHSNPVHHGNTAVRAEPANLRLIFDPPDRIIFVKKAIRDNGGCVRIAPGWL